MGACLPGQWQCASASVLGKSVCLRCLPFASETALGQATGLCSACPGSARDGGPQKPLSGGRLPALALAALLVCALRMLASVRVLMQLLLAFDSSGGLLHMLCTLSPAAAVAGLLLAWQPCNCRAWDVPYSANDPCILLPGASECISVEPHPGLSVASELGLLLLLLMVLVSPCLAL